jgi:hypothetical protein
MKIAKTQNNNDHLGQRIFFLFVLVCKLFLLLINGFFSFFNEDQLFLIFLDSFGFDFLDLISIPNFIKFINFHYFTSQVYYLLLLIKRLFNQQLIHFIF